MRSPLDTIIGHAIRAVRFVESVRGEFTVRDLAESAELARSGAYRYLTILSRHYRIYEVSEYRHGAPMSSGAVAARYRVDRD